MARKTVERLSYFSFYIADYLLDTGDLTLAQHGAYTLLMLRYYWQGHLSEHDLYKGCANESDRVAIDFVLARFFKKQDGGWKHNRIERELEAIGRFVEIQSVKGKLSAEARRKKKMNGAQPGFDAFYQSYPLHKGRAKAERAWIAVKPDEALTARIMAAVETQKKSADWKKENGKFIPHPASWLNGKRWEDEVVAGPVQPGERLPDGSIKLAL